MNSVDQNTKAIAHLASRQATIEATANGFEKRIGELETTRDQRLVDRVELQDVKIGELVTQVEQLNLIFSELQEEIADLKTSSGHD